MFGCLADCVFWEGGWIEGIEVGKERGRGGGRKRQGRFGVLCCRDGSWLGKSEEKGVQLLSCEYSNSASRLRFFPTLYHQVPWMLLTTDWRRSYLHTHIPNHISISVIAFAINPTRSYHCTRPPTPSACPPRTEYNPPAAYRKTPD